MKALERLPAQKNAAPLYGEAGRRVSQAGLA